MKVTLWIVGVLILLGIGYFLLSGDAEEPPPVLDPITQRSTTNGDVVGFTDSYGANVWLGLPFAAAPVGDARWRSPQVGDSWSKPREALNVGPICPQFASLLSGGGVGASGVAGGEDCLYLNVYAPPNAKDLPVMFWIHGGGNTIGHGGSYIGSPLATSQQVVVVTINYRLGLLGWFNHPAIANGNPKDDSGNFGTLDIIEALQWTRSNVANFGGDPYNVTVFGESAGAFDTLAMMASPLAKGLFHKAIVQSGGFSPTPVSSGQDYAAEGGHALSARELVNLRLVADGQAADTDAATLIQNDMSQSQLRDYLYSLKVEDIFGVLDGGGFGMINVPDNFGDGHVLPNLKTEQIFSVAANHNQVPVILGTNRDEVALFVSQSPEFVDSFLGVFRSLKNEDRYRRLVDYQSAAWKARGVDSLADYMTASGNPNVYGYRFDWDEEPNILGYELSKALGAAHALEIAFVFGEFDKGLGLGYVYPNDDAQWALSKSMMSYWAQFAYTGDPGGGRDGNEAEWLAWGKDGKTSIILDSPADKGIRMWDQKVTNASLKQALAMDTTFESQRERCTQFVDMFSRDPDFDTEEFNNLGDVGCRDFSVEELRSF